MTSPASRKSAERQRRKDAGEVRLDCWVPAEIAAWLDDYRKPFGLTHSDAIKALIIREHLRSEKS